MRKKRVLIGSPVRQKAIILKEFLLSLNELEEEKYIADFMFIDDNDDKSKESSELLQEFKEQQFFKKVTIIKPEAMSRLEMAKGSGIGVGSSQQEDYICDQNTHYWKDSLIEKVALYKNNIIKEAILKKYDFLFLIDSDLIINPKLIEHLISKNKDIVSEVFWTAWVLGMPPLPNVWISDQYTMFKKDRGEEITKVQATERVKEFFNKLKTPGTYEVGGLGACTLINRKALKMGINFNLIENLSFWGEDRHFCVRASSLGLKLFADTHYPVYHIYRESDLAGVSDYKEKGISNLEQIQKQAKISNIANITKANTKGINLVTTDSQKSQILRYYKEQNNKLTLSMIIRNEADRYLEKMLNAVKGCIDEAVIIDDGSEDNSIELCKSIMRDKPLHIIRNNVPKFSNEFELRKQQWEETIKTEPDWILNLEMKLLEE